MQSAAEAVATSLPRLLPSPINDLFTTALDQLTVKHATTCAISAGSHRLLITGLLCSQWWGGAFYIAFSSELGFNSPSWRLEATASNWQGSQLFKGIEGMPQIVSAVISAFSGLDAASMDLLVTVAMPASAWIPPFVDLRGVWTPSHIAINATLPVVRLGASLELEVRASVHGAPASASGPQFPGGSVLSATAVFGSGDEAVTVASTRLYVSPHRFGMRAELPNVLRLGGATLRSSGVNVSVDLATLPFCRARTPAPGYRPCDGCLALSRGQVINYLPSVRAHGWRYGFASDGQAGYFPARMVDEFAHDLGYVGLASGAWVHIFAQHWSGGREWLQLWDPDQGVWPKRLAASDPDLVYRSPTSRDMHRAGWRATLEAEVGPFAVVLTAGAHAARLSAGLRRALRLGDLLAALAVTPLPDAAAARLGVLGVRVSEARVEYGFGGGGAGLTVAATAEWSGASATLELRVPPAPDTPPALLLVVPHRDQWLWSVDVSLGWAEAIFGQAQLLLAYGPARRVERIGDRQLPVPLAVPEGLSVVAALAVRSSGHPLLRALGAWLGVRSVVAFLRMSAEARWEIGVTMAFAPRDFWVGHLDNVTLRMRDWGTVEGEAVLALKNGDSVAAALTWAAPNLELEFRYEGGWDVLGLDWAVLRSAAFRFGFASGAWSAYGDVEFRRSGRRYAGGVVTGPGIAGVRLGHPRPIQYLSVGTLLLDFFPLPLPAGLAAVLRVAVLQDLTVQGLAAARPYTFPDGAELQPGLFFAARRVELLWGWIQGSVTLAVAPAEPRIACDAHVEDFTLVGVLRVRSVQLRLHLARDRAELSFSGSVWLVGLRLRVEFELVQQHLRMALRFSVVGLAVAFDAWLWLGRGAAPGDVEVSALVEVPEGWLSDLVTGLWAWVKRTLRQVVDIFMEAVRLYRWVLEQFGGLYAKVGQWLTGGKFQPQAAPAAVAPARRAAAAGLRDAAGLSDRELTERLRRACAALPDAPRRQGVAVLLNAATHAERRRMLVQVAQAPDPPTGLLESILQDRLLQVPGGQWAQTAQGLIPSLGHQRVHDMLHLALQMSTNVTHLLSRLLETTLSRASATAGLSGLSELLEAPASDAAPGDAALRVRRGVRASVLANASALGLTEAQVDDALGRLDWGVFVSGALTLGSLRCGAHADREGRLNARCHRHDPGACLAAALARVDRVTCDGLEGRTTRALEDLLVSALEGAAQRSTGSARRLHGFVGGWASAVSSAVSSAVDSAIEGTKTVVSAVAETGAYVAEKTWDGAVYVYDAGTAVVDKGKALVWDAVQWGMSQVEFVAMLKRFQRFLAGGAFQFRSLRVRASLRDLGAHQELEADFDFQFLGLSCCPPVALQLDVSTLLSLVSDLIQSFLLAPVQAITGAQKFQPQSQDRVVSEAEAALCQRADWAVPPDFSPGPALEPWLGHLFPGCDGGPCAAARTPARQDLLETYRPPLYRNGSWLYWDLVCGAYVRKGHRVLRRAPNSTAQGNGTLDATDPGSVPQFVELTTRALPDAYDDPVDRVGLFQELLAEFENASTNATAGAFPEWLRPLPAGPVVPPIAPYAANATALPGCGTGPSGDGDACARLIAPHAPGAAASGAGIVFALHARTAQVVTGLHLHLTHPNTEVAVYQLAVPLPASLDAVHAAPGAWTYIGEAVVPGCCATVPVPLPLNVSLGPNASTALYVTAQGGGIEYARAGPRACASAGLAIGEALGVHLPFRAVWGAAQFVGGVAYCAGGISGDAPAARAATPTPSPPPDAARSATLSLTPTDTAPGAVGSGVGRGAAVPTGAPGVWLFVLGFSGGAVAVAACVGAARCVAASRGARARGPTRASQRLPRSSREFPRPSSDSSATAVHGFEDVVQLRCSDASPLPVEPPDLGRSPRSKASLAGDVWGLPRSGTPARARPPAFAAPMSGNWVVLPPPGSPCPNPLASGALSLVQGTDGAHADAQPVPSEGRRRSGNSVSTVLMLEAGLDVFDFDS